MKEASQTDEMKSTIISMQNLLRKTVEDIIQIKEETNRNENGVSNLDEKLNGITL